MEKKCEKRETPASETGQGFLFGHIEIFVADRTGLITPCGVNVRRDAIQRGHGPDVIVGGVGGASDPLQLKQEVVGGSVAIADGAAHGKEAVGSVGNRGVCGPVVIHRIFTNPGVVNPCFFQFCHTRCDGAAFPHLVMDTDCGLQRLGAGGGEEGIREDAAVKTEGYPAGTGAEEQETAL